MPEDTVYITIMRKPSDLFSSLFYYFKINDVYDTNLTQFLREPFFLEIIRKSRLHQSMGFNQIAFDLGADIGEAWNDTSPSLRRLIDATSRRFQLVMIAERFLESLVLLRHLLCWDLGQ